MIVLIHRQTFFQFDRLGRGGVFLAHQVIINFVTDSFSIGGLGLSFKYTNITSFNDQIAESLSTLSQQKIIFVISGSYLAGVSYYSYPVSAFGSLTFGGYGSTRLDLKNNLTLARGSGECRPFLLGIEDIVSDSDIFLSEQIIVALDSRQSDLVADCFLSCMWVSLWSCLEWDLWIISSQWCSAFCPSCPQCQHHVYTKHEPS